MSLESYRTPIRGKYKDYRQYLVRTKIRSPTIFYPRSYFHPIHTVSASSSCRSSLDRSCDIMFFILHHDHCALYGSFPSSSSGIPWLTKNNITFTLFGHPHNLISILIPDGICACRGARISKPSSSRILSSVIIPSVFATVQSPGSRTVTFSFLNSYRQTLSEDYRDSRMHYVHTAVAV